MLSITRKYSFDNINVIDKRNIRQKKQLGGYMKTMLISVILLVAILLFDSSCGGNSATRENTRAFAYAITNLEAGQTVLLGELTPFEWDYLHVFNGYVGMDFKQEYMGIPRRHLSRSIGEITHIYFLNEGIMVARMYSSGAGFFLSFGYREVVLENGNVVFIRDGTFAYEDELEMLTGVSRMHDGSERVWVRLVEY